MKILTLNILIGSIQFIKFYLNFNQFLSVMILTRFYQFTSFSRFYFYLLIFFYNKEESIIYTYFLIYIFQILFCFYPIFTHLCLTDLQ